jgi:uncharacterized surface protein with fasciclin (FAS1) repeats
VKTKENVFEAIKNDERLRILTKMLESTGIAQAMSEEREQFTFFAPTDVAFGKLSSAALRHLTGPDGKELIAVMLGRHLIPKAYLGADDLRSGKSLLSLYGHELKVKAAADVLRLEGALILLPAITASNAVVFPVNKILSAPRQKIMSAPRRKMMH